MIFEPIKSNQKSVIHNEKQSVMCCIFQHIISDQPTGRGRPLLLHTNGGYEMKKYSLEAAS